MIKYIEARKFSFFFVNILFCINLTLFKTVVYTLQEKNVCCFNFLQFPVFVEYYENKSNYKVYDVIQRKMFSSKNWRYKKKIVEQVEILFFQIVTPIKKYSKIKQTSHRQ